ncbi:hypothetical protein Pint_06075 [Pistacia integerrima]|uniref:Uncharacterized protein n=1 Tax=Pistacia integerrima TaxID=434235 RepID=A0ACC0Z313_9ROSI|nr:hypothetical protein Pint_06075 [Pistacia integerrima]
MDKELVKERTLEKTPTWALAVVCFVLIAISIFIEHLIHMVGKWLKKKHKRALYEALEKVKAELMLMGFLSFLLMVLQDTISEICVPKSVADSWHPCSEEMKDKVKDGKNYDKCAEKARTKLFLLFLFNMLQGGKVAFVSAYGIHELHIFIFILAIFHIIYCITILALGRTKMKRWRVWEDETKTIEYQYYNDPERFRFARDTSFGRRHLTMWSESSFSLWIVCFFRQFFGAVTKVDYLTLRHGFIMAHLAPGSETKFDFNKYISRSLEEDFIVVVGISPILWFVSMLFLLTNTHGWFAYLWLPFIPLIIILLVGTKLQVIITKLGLRFQDTGNVVQGAPVVKPGDDLFWFGRPRFILFLIHLVLFQNAFQLAFFIWSTYKYTIKSCFHHRTEDIVIRISMGVLTHILCSYVTLPLYALVTQMGTAMKPTIFNDRVAAALKNWHHTAKSHTKHGKHSALTTPFSSRPQTPTHGMSPVHLLHNYPNRSADSYHPSPPRPSNFDNERWDPESLHLHSPEHYEVSESHHHGDSTASEQEMVAVPETSSMQLPPGPRPVRTQHEINMGRSEFSFGKRSS